ncbi:MAG: class I SAM-dependent methyltransferase [Gammaproteobacteria bacterium]|nr:MAG: class I SAM-dependent methyltransferase [Gammaproteobacteria bacterium]
MESNKQDIVNDQYENYPYPGRNPEDEKKRLSFTSLDDLEVINSLGFKGKLDFDNISVLVAGGGTGDAVIYIAEQLRNCPGARIIYCDLSSASMKIAKERAEVRGLDNITWMNQSFLELDEYLGRFDYINSSGVIHHLEDPEGALKYLKKLLKPNGGVMGIMVYAQIGRTAVYQIQEIVRLISDDSDDLVDKIQITKDVINNAPSTNWWKHCSSFIDDFNSGWDTDIVDMFLHAQDRAYTIPELYEFIENCEMILVDFSMPYRYELTPEACGMDEKIIQILKGKSVKEQQAIVELYSGKLMKHTFFLSNKNNTNAKITDNSNIPFLHNADLNVKQLADAIDQNKYSNVAFTLGKKYKTNFDVGKYTTEIIRNIDGNKTVGEIFAAVSQKFGGKVKREEFDRDFKRFYKSLNQYDLLLLRNKKCKKMLLRDRLHDHVLSMYR